MEGLLQKAYGLGLPEKCLARKENLLAPLFATSMLDHLKTI
jgi:hypothetical protein